MASNFDDARRLEEMLDDTIRSFATEHGPFLRALFELPSDSVPLGITYCAFLGKTLERLGPIMGRVAIETLVSNALDKLETVTAAVEAAGNGSDGLAELLTLTRSPPA
jgi:hypothetical protein